jgi:hypothetical protein
MSPSALAAHERREFASEIKFLIDPATAVRVREWARQHLAADPNASGPTGDTYHVTSLYFDTPDFSVFHRRGWLRYSKFRIRRYGTSTIFLERKLKVSGRVAKRRTAITATELAHLEQPLLAQAWPGAWFRHKTGARQLRPVCQIDYQRTARVLATPSGPIRLTLDEAICAMPIRDQRFQERTHSNALTDRVVLELKFRRDLPVLFRELAGQFALTPHPFSKYRTAVQSLGLVPDLQNPVRSVSSAA